MDSKFRQELPDIKGFQEVTLIDWDGKVASIIFLAGCNLRCPFCHSGSLVMAASKLESVPFKEIENFLKKKKGWVDGIVITGGEPTLNEGQLLNLILAIKEFGLLVKLDTNGTRPKTLKRILDAKIIDYVAMDIKAPLSTEAYSKAAGVAVIIEDIVSSKDIVLSSDIDYEFRTTVVPGLIGKAEVTDIAKSISPCKKYCLQQFMPREPIDPSLLKVKPYPLGELDKMAGLASKHLPNVIIRKN